MVNALAPVERSRLEEELKGIQEEGRELEAEAIRIQEILKEAKSPTPVVIAPAPVQAPAVAPTPAAPPAPPTEGVAAPIDILDIPESLKPFKFILSDVSPENKDSGFYMLDGKYYKVEQEPTPLVMEIVKM